MFERSNIVYLYDGSYEGLLCCIFESYEKHEIPVDIQPENTDQMTLYGTKIILTDISKYNRVREGLMKKTSEDVYSYIEYGYYTCYPKKELLILDFIGLCIKYGIKVLGMLTNNTVLQLQNSVKALTREAHQFQGFVRFSIYGDFMLSVIEPRNFVLPLLAPHFCDRYANETFMIYDKTHNEALIYQPGNCDIVHLNNFQMPKIEEDELKYRCLWKQFYDTIAIEDRYNPECRRTHMQKRYWKHLTEMDDNIKTANNKKIFLDFKYK